MMPTFVYESLSLNTFTSTMVPSSDGFALYNDIKKVSK